MASLWAQKAPLADILSSELVRNFEALKAKGTPAPYFISYSVADVTEDVVRASYGALLRSGTERRRFFDCSVRSGSPQLDNYHRLPGQTFRMARAATLPLDDLPNPIRRILWYETNHCYEASVSRLAAVQSHVQTAPPNPPLPDFSLSGPVTSITPLAAARLDRDAWAARLRNLSAGFKEFPAVLQSEISVTNHTAAKALVNSEGTRLLTGSNFSRVVISCRAKAADGEDMQLSDSFEAFDPSKLPNDKVLLDALILQADLMSRLKRSPELEPFTGPAIFSGAASAMLFAEVLGKGVESRGADSAPLAGQLGQAVLPETFTVISAPTIHQAGPFDLIGSYSHDDEGVPARPVAVVEKGVLKSLLTSRAPAPGFPHSNGHGRKQPGFEASGRLSNLFVDSSVTVAGEDLKAKLVAEATRQRKPYGLYIERIRFGDPPPPQQGAAQPRPVIIVSAYRISANGRKDQLVRGAVIAGDRFKILKNIIAASDFKQAVNLMEQGESGLVPVSIVAPPILVSEVETKPSVKPSDRPPFLPRPE